MKKHIAIIVRTYNNEEILKNTLLSIMGQVDVEFNIYAIDSNSSDSTLDILKSFNVKIFSIGDMKYHPAKVLNKYLSCINEDIFIFVNSDTVLLTPFVFSHLLKKIDEHGVAATYGRQLARPDAWPEVKRDYISSFPPLKDDRPGWITISFPIACIKRSEWVEQKFYLSSWGSEDTEWGDKVQAKGRIIDYCPEAIVMHSHNYDKRQLCNRAFVEGEADYYIYARDFKLIRYTTGLIKKIYRDVKACFSFYKFNRIPTVIIRVCVQHYNYYKGILSAKTRDMNNNNQVVFKDYQ
jgi:rhamnosyltransferase